MKKILIAVLLTAVATSSFAAKTNKVLAAGMNTVTSATDCPLLSSDVKINLSAANIGNVSCDSSTATLGVAVANTSGKFHVYAASSAGGSLVETTTTAAPTASDVSTAADTASSSS